MNSSNPKDFDQTITSMEKMAEGLEHNREIEQYPGTTSKEEVLGLKDELVDIRQRYEQARNESYKLREIYEKKLEEAINNISRLKRIIYGVYGRKNPIVYEFGLLPYKN